MQKPKRSDQFKPGSEFNLTTRPSPSQTSNEPEAIEEVESMILLTNQSG